MNNTGKKVYITNLGFHDYSLAKVFGELVPVTIGHVDLEQDELEKAILTKIEAMSPFDYLLVSGSPLIASLALGFVQARFGTVNLLSWDPLAKDYALREPDFSQKLEEVDDPL